MNIIRRIVKSIPLIVVLLVIIELVWTNTLVRSGKDITEIDLKIADLRLKNEALAQQVASASSLLTITKKASESGFVEPKSTQFVMMGSETLPVALISQGR